MLTAAVVALELNTRPLAAGSGCCCPLSQVKPTVATYVLPPDDGKRAQEQVPRARLLKAALQAICCFASIPGIAAEEKPHTHAPAVGSPMVTNPTLNVAIALHAQAVSPLVLPDPMSTNSAA